MNKIKLLMIFGCFFIFGCDEYTRIEESEFLIETAVVDQLIYSPSHSSSDLNIGLTLDGDFALTPTTTSIPPKYGVVFKCQHGKFYIGRKELWESLSVGDCVIITYKELFKVKYVDHKPVHRDIYKLDFLDAEKIDCPLDK